MTKKERYATDKDYREKTKAQALKWYYDNREKALARIKKWRKNNPEKCKEYGKNHTTRNSGCEICGEPLITTKPIKIDDMKFCKQCEPHIQSYIQLNRQFKETGKLPTSDDGRESAFAAEKYVEPKWLKSVFN